jgi:tetratricopeptide (TPR) repeat protein
VRDEVDEAKRYWDAALALNPNNTQALVGIGDYHKFANRFDEAQPYDEKAIALEPQTPITNSTMANISSTARTKVRIRSRGQAISPKRGGILRAVTNSTRTIRRRSGRTASRIFSRVRMWPRGSSR